MGPAVQQNYPMTYQSERDFDPTSLKIEHNRLKTFIRFPDTVYQSPVSFAFHGFVYACNAGHDAVKCVFCNLVKSGWHKNDIIEQVHAALSNTCPMVTKSECGNVAIYKTLPFESWDVLISKYKTLRQSEKCKSNHCTLSPGLGENETASESLSKARATPQNIKEPPVKSEDKTSLQTVPGTRLQQPVAQEAEHNVHTALVTNQTFCMSHSSSKASQGNRASISNTNTHSNSPSASLCNTSTTSTLSNHSSSVSASQTRATTSVASSKTNKAAKTKGKSDSTSRSNFQNSSQTNSVDEVDASARPPVDNSTNDTQQTQQPARSTPSYEQLNILTSRPKRPEYAVKAIRLESFRGWPDNHHLKPEDLTDAGFFYTGYRDTARCFYCGGGLRNWETTDDVWVEHARWFPQCAYMKIIKGKDFVEAVQNLSKSQEVISYDDAMKEAAIINPEKANRNQLKNDPAVLTLQKLGLPKGIILNAVTKFNASNNGIVPTSDQLYEQIVKENNMEKQRIEILKSAETADKDVIEGLREQNSDLRQQTVCKICLDKEVGVVFLPCGHFMSCTDCASALKLCPVCRIDVKGMVRAFIS